MKTRRSTKLFATVAAASLVLAACGGDDDDAGDEGTTEELMAQPDVDGALVGGASLDPEEFARIVQIASA